MTLKLHQTLFLILFLHLTLLQTLNLRLYFKQYFSKILLCFFHFPVVLTFNLFTGVDKGPLTGGWRRLFNNHKSWRACTAPQGSSLRLTLPYSTEIHRIRWVWHIVHSTICYRERFITRCCNLLAQLPNDLSVFYLLLIIFRRLLIYYYFTTFLAKKCSTTICQH